MQKLKGQLSDFRNSPAILENERDVVDRMLSYIEENGDEAFYRTHRPAHFTASALVISPDAKQVLLMLHKKLGKWLQPGGHADGDVNLKQVAIREVQEETGVEVEDHDQGIYGVDWHPIPANAKEDAHSHADCAYLFRAMSWDLVRNFDEAGDLRWFSVEEALALVDDGSVRKLIGRYNESLRNYL